MIKTTDIEKAAREYAMHVSTAPDKETHDWIISDFKAGAKWERDNGDITKLLTAVLACRNYIPIRLRREIARKLDFPF